MLCSSFSSFKVFLRLAAYRQHIQMSDAKTGLMHVASLPIRLGALTCVKRVFACSCNPTYIYKHMRDQGSLSNTYHHFSMVNLAAVSMAGIAPSSPQACFLSGRDISATSAHLRSSSRREAVCQSKQQLKRMYTLVSSGLTRSLAPAQQHRTTMFSAHRYSLSSTPAAVAAAAAANVTPAIELRNAQPEDLQDILAINEAAVPAVNSLSPHDMRRLFDQAASFRVAALPDGEVRLPICSQHTSLHLCFFPFF